MKFSIIIPAYNAEDRIRKALDSIRQQTFTDYELIVVCDSCTDQTEQIAKEYGARTVNVEYHRDGLTRNRGIEMARGEWILFMDDDDWWLHEYVLSYLNDEIEKSDFDVLAFGFVFKGMGLVKPIRHSGRRWIAVWNKLWKRECIGETRFSNEWSVSDVYFNKKMMEKDLKIKDSDVTLYYYNYLRPGSITEGDRNVKQRAN